MLKNAKNVELRGSYGVVLSKLKVHTPIILCFAHMTYYLILCHASVTYYYKSEGKEWRERDDMPGFNSTNSQIHQKMQKCRVKDAINPVDTFIGGGAASFLFQQI